MTVQLSEDEYQALQLGAELDDIRKPNTITSNILGRINSLSYETKLLTASMEHQGTSGSQAQDADSNPMPAGGKASSAGEISACLTSDQGGIPKTTDSHIICFCPIFPWSISIAVIVLITNYALKCTKFSRYSYAGLFLK